MKLFINNTRVKLLHHSKNLKDKNFDVIVDGAEQLDVNKTHGNVLVIKANEEKIALFIKALELTKLEKVKSITFLVDDVKLANRYIKSNFKVIKAAGGVVVKNDKILMIHRLNAWDLPKGKLEEGELTNEGAIREVEEECNVKVKEIEKLCSTWHTYTAKEKKIIKKTTWFIMSCLDDSSMKPQKEEGIDKIQWMSRAEAEDALYDSYASIQYVIKRYKKYTKLHI